MIIQLVKEQKDAPIVFGVCKPSSRKFGTM